MRKSGHRLSGANPALNYESITFHAFGLTQSERIAIEQMHGASRQAHIVGRCQIARRPNVTFIVAVRASRALPGCRLIESTNT
jgi:hypothetical protein